MPARPGAGARNLQGNAIDASTGGGDEAAGNTPILAVVEQVPGVNWVYCTLMDWHDEFSPRSYH